MQTLNKFCITLLMTMLFSLSAFAQEETVTPVESIVNETEEVLEQVTETDSEETINTEVSNLDDSVDTLVGDSLANQVEPNSDSTDESNAVDGISDLNDESKQAIIIDYVVLPGDTLSSLTEKHLTDPELWRRNAEINPELENFNYLEPGTTIRLITGYAEPEPEVEAHQAKVILKNNQVNKSVQRGDWTDVDQGENLYSGDGLRTLAESSAVIQFESENAEEQDTEASKNQVQIFENSRVYVTKEKSEETSITRNEIEIQKGGAKLELDTSVSGDEALEEYEINVGGVIAKPTLDADGKAETKARIENEASQVMVYSGNSEVESGGESVAVEQGMGTIAKAGEAPAEPEKLLEAPSIGSSNPKVSEPDTEIPLTWNALDGADSYRLEVCSDMSCSSVNKRFSGLKEASHTINGLPEGKWFWRVSGVSPSGLDGFPSATQLVTVKKAPPPPPAPSVPWIVWALIIAGALTFIIAVIEHIRETVSTS